MQAPASGLLPSEPPASAVPGLEFLSEPALIVDLGGRIRRSNAAARGVFGGAVTDGTATLFDLVRDPRDVVADHLRRASGSTAPHVGSITPAGGAGSDRYRAMSARLQAGAADPVLVIVRLMPIRDEQFSVLNRRLQDMDRQLHQRRKENALLNEALAENKVLLKELQHRVKNNIQQMLSLIKMSARNQPSADVARVLATASDRLRAMAVAQEALYRNSATRAISSGDFLHHVVTGAASSYGASDRLRLSVAHGDMTPDEAHCLALIANEFVTNACKYALDDPGATIRVLFLVSDDGFCLEVRDDGPGFAHGAPAHASGLALVRALCRQIGGKLDVTGNQGAICAVHFRTELNDKDRP